MLWLEVLILAVIQGLTEFLPVSSSGHIVVGETLWEQFVSGVEPMDERAKLTISIMLHLGTLAAILVFYWQRLCRLLGEDRRLIGLLAVGTLPAVIVGVPLKEFGEGLLTNTLLAGLMFPITGAVLIWSARYDKGQTTCRELGYRQALLIGLFQAFAILPGISRSGATIVAGLGCGLKRDEAAAFSFLLAIPAIGGAGLLESIDLISSSNGTAPLGTVLAGTAVSFVVGLLSLWWLVRWVREGRLHLFAWYVIPLGLIVVAWQLCVRFAA